MDQEEISKITDNPPARMPNKAREIWLRCATTLYAKGKLQSKDRIWFELFCDTYARIANAKEKSESARTEAEREIHLQVVTDFTPIFHEMLADIGFDSPGSFELFLKDATQ